MSHKKLLFIYKKKHHFIKNAGWGMVKCLPTIISRYLFVKFPMVLGFTTMSFGYLGAFVCISNL